MLVAEDAAGIEVNKPFTRKDLIENVGTALVRTGDSHALPPWAMPAVRDRCAKLALANHPARQA
jgi:hypothetical protein